MKKEDLKNKQKKQQKKTPTELTRETWTCFLPYNGSVCSNKLELSGGYCTYVKGNCWDTSDQIQQAVLLDVLKDTNFALVSTAPSRLHCYVLEKAQFGLLKPVLTQGYQVFFCVSCIIYKYIQHLQLTFQRHCQVPWLIKPSGSPVSPLAAVQSFSLPRSCRHSGKLSTQHLNHCLSYVSCCVLKLSVRHICLVKPPPVVGSEFMAIILSTWKISLHFAWKLCPVYFHCFFFVCLFLLLLFVCFVLFISMQVVHVFNTFQWFVLASIACEGCCCDGTTDIPASVLLAFQHMECLLLIYFCICYCCYKMP